MFKLVNAMPRAPDAEGQTVRFGNMTLDEWMDAQVMAMI
jgi:hypothetical protein